MARAVGSGRKWTYIAYDPMHADFATYQSKNLFGRVEEERDADGLRFFEYDWRGLVTKVSHRFWSLKDGSARDWDNASSDLWSTGDAWDPAVPSTARGSITDWLALDDLTDTTTVAVSTTYDAAGRPTEVTWPEGVKLRSTWNAAGLLSKLEVDRGTGAGYFDAMTNAAYNARGQLTEHTSGNGAVTTRTYDDDLERLVRLVTTRTSGGSTTDFQDLGYDYDPAGNPVELTDNLATSSYRANQVIPNTRTFRYDPRYRLVRATGKKHRSVGDKSVNPLVASPDDKDYEPYTFRYSYDAVGNFTTNQEYARGTNSLNYKATRLDLFNGDAGEATSTNPTAGNFRYDENGNTTKTPRITQLAYTMDNQARYADLGGGGQVRYLRHGDQRVVRVVNKTGVKALGVYLGPWEYHQRQGSTAYTKVVLHVIGAVGRVAQVERVLAGSDPDSLSVFYAHGDHLGSAQVLTKSDGTLLSQEEYFPYGRSSDRRDSRNRYRFIGVETDEDTGLCMTGPRTYDAVSGRFLQVDPVRKAERSPYDYCGARSIGLADPSGYDEQTTKGHNRDRPPRSARGAEALIAPDTAVPFSPEALHRRNHPMRLTPAQSEVLSRAQAEAGDVEIRFLIVHKVGDPQNAFEFTGFKAGERERVNGYTLKEALAIVDEMSLARDAEYELWGEGHTHPARAGLDRSVQSGKYRPHRLNGQLYSVYGDGATFAQPFTSANVPYQVSLVVESTVGRYQDATYSILQRPRDAAPVDLPRYGSIPTHRGNYRALTKAIGPEFTYWLGGSVRGGLPYGESLSERDLR